MRARGCRGGIVVGVGGGRLVSCERGDVETKGDGWGMRLNARSGIVGMTGLDRPRRDEDKILHST